MLKYLLIVFCAAWLGSLFGCTRKPTVVTIDQLTFPVVRIFGTSTERKISSYTEVVANKEDLSYASMDFLGDAVDTNSPIVIDSNANIVDMKNMKLYHGGLWIMIYPTSQQRFHFTLVKRKETGIEASRNLIVKCLRRGWDGERQELRCERIRQASTMEEMMKIIREKP